MVVTVQYTKLPTSAVGQAGPGQSTTNAPMTGDESATGAAGQQTQQSQQTQQRLPQTGDDAQANAGIIGLLLTAMAGFLGLGSKRKQD